MDIELELLNKSLEGTLSSPNSLQGELTGGSSLTGTLSNEVLRGYSAYQMAVLNGYVGTETEWLESLNARMRDEDRQEVVDELKGIIPTKTSELNNDSGYLDESTPFVDNDGVLIFPSKEGI